MKYCTNCGNKINEEADLCLKCGKLINKAPNNNKKVNIGEIFSIIGMVLGILGFLTILIMSLALADYKEEFIEEILIARIYLAIIFTMFSLAPSVPGLVLSIIGERKKKNIYGIIGLVMSLLALLLIIASFIYIIW